MFMQEEAGTTEQKSGETREKEGGKKHKFISSL